MDEWPLSLLGAVGRLPLSYEAQELDFWWPELPVRVEALSLMLPSEVLRCIISGPNIGSESSFLDKSCSWLLWAHASWSGASSMTDVVRACWKPRWPTIDERRRCKRLVLCADVAKSAELLVPSLGGRNLESRKAPSRSSSSFSSQWKSHVDSASCS
jgi:hypothetical protein